MRKIVVKPGDKYNKLTIIEEISNGEMKRRTFKCKCDCGNETIVGLNNLRNNHTKSCGKCDYAPIKIGDKYGHWTVIGNSIKGSVYHKKYLCECDCKEKTQRYVDEQNLKRGLSTNCGCIGLKHLKDSNTKHGMSHTRIFYIWSCMKQRCYNPNDSRYKDYGGRGITVCKEWLDSFETFYKWAIANGYRDDLTIDRIDVDGKYCPQNCRWATNKEQSNNRRTNVKITYKNETHNINEWSEITGIKRATISSRYKKGYPLEDVFFYGKFPAGKRRVI